MQLNVSHSSEIILGTVKDLKKEIHNAEDYICRGAAPDYAKYKEKSGYIAGLKKAAQLLNDHEKRFTNQNPDGDE